MLRRKDHDTAVAQVCAGAWLVSHPLLLLRGCPLLLFISLFSALLLFELSTHVHSYGRVFLGWPLWLCYHTLLLCAALWFNLVWYPVYWGTHFVCGLVGFPQGLLQSLTNILIGLCVLCGICWLILSLMTTKVRARGTDGEDAPDCGICCDAKLTHSLQCGHTYCEVCARKAQEMGQCFQCRKAPGELRRFYL